MGLLWGLCGCGGTGARVGDCDWGPTEPQDFVEAHSWDFKVAAEAIAVYLLSDGNKSRVPS